MATLNVQTIVHGGLEPAYVSCSGLPEGDEFPNNGKTFIHLKSTAIQDWTVTVHSEKDCDQGHEHDLEVKIPRDDGDVMIGPFKTERFNDASGKVDLTYTGVTSMVIAVLSLS